MQKRFAIHTLGCKVNQYESEAISELFLKAGYEKTDFDNFSDVYIVNTCTVTGMSDRKSRQIIRRAKRINPDSIMVVTGCYAQTANEEVKEIEGVNLIVGTKDRNRMIDLVEGIKAGNEPISIVGDIMDLNSFEEMDVNTYSERTRAYIKVQDGCESYCTYCIIPYARGKIRSRPVKNVLKEVETLAQNGFSEIVVTGIHVASYGKDLDNVSLIDLLTEINKVEGVKRIRMSSVEPGLITDGFINTAKKLDKLQHHFHLSLQSGCDETLKRMNRKYTANDYKIAVDRLRNAFPDVGITTDLMVGFPSETDLEFEKTKEFVEKISFSGMHIFKYSKRKGTPAAVFKDQVSPQEKDIRSKVIEDLAKQSEDRFAKKFVGESIEVLFEEEIEENIYSGKTGNYLTVIMKSDIDLCGKIIKVVPSDCKNGVLVV